MKETKDQTMLVIVTLSTLLSLASCFDDYKVLLSSDGPAVLDAPISFFGDVGGDEMSEDTRLRWRWVDTTSPGHLKEIESNGTTRKMNYTLTYPSSVTIRCHLPSSNMSFSSGNKLGRPGPSSS